MSTRHIITDYEMDRRRAVCAASTSLTNAMVGHSLTPVEWLAALQAVQERMLNRKLREEWTDEEAEAGKVATDDNGN